MAVTFDPANGGKQYLHENSHRGVAEPELRGILDFGSVMKTRGLLDAQASTVAIGGATSAATRFDEGSLFGHATSSRREPVVGRIAAESETSHTAKSAADRINGTQRPTTGLRSSSASSGAGTGSNSLAGGEALIGSRFVQRVFDNRPPSVSATTVAGAGPRAPSGGKAFGSGAAGSGASLASRARHVEALGPVHVIARNCSNGVELTVRAAGVAGEQADLLERRLRKAAAEEGADVTSVRLNGADRPDRAGRPRNG